MKVYFSLILLGTLLLTACKEQEVLEEGISINKELVEELPLENESEAALEVEDAAMETKTAPAATIGTTSPLNFVWYEDEFVKFQYPEGAVVEKVSLQDYQNLFEPSLVENDDWKTYSMHEESSGWFYMLINQGEKMQDGRNSIYYSEKEGLRIWDIYLKEEISLQGEVSLLAFGPEDLNLYLLHSAALGELIYVVQKRGDDYRGEYIVFPNGVEEIHSTTPLMSTAFFERGQQEAVIELNLILKAKEASAMEQAATILDNFFNTFPIQNWEYRTTKEFYSIP